MHFNLGNRGRTGALLWISSLQYFITQLIVIAAWTVPHSFVNNFISDLGNTECGQYAGLAVCSPLHLLMNASFVTFGLTMAGGALLLRKCFAHSTLTDVGFGMMAVAGIGTMLVGLFPENTVGPLHVLGAVLGLGIGNLSVILIGAAARPMQPVLRTYTILSGIVSLTAFALFAAEIYAGIGRGGMERLISYPFTLWMMVSGIAMLMSHRKASS
jgi:hypothetical membrane protein